MKSLIQNKEIIRYVINGLVATAVHYGILNFNLIILEIESAGIANFIAAIFGICVSFIGSRYYVYQNHTNSLKSQITKFLSLYGFIATLHGITLFIWHDVYALNYHLGFIIATFLQVSLSYIGNKTLVFKNEN
jgi:putative flippase GtrA